MQSADPNDGKTGLSLHNKIDLAVLASTVLLLPSLLGVLPFSRQTPNHQQQQQEQHHVSTGNICYILYIALYGALVTGELRIARWKNCPNASLSTTIPTLTSLTSNPGLRVERLATTSRAMTGLFVSL